MTGWNGPQDDLILFPQMKLPKKFYLRNNVVKIARDLLGKFLFSSIDGIVTGGIITETEAYAGVNDRASHAFGGRRTTRTEVMYAEGGASYVYLCYGIHSLFNVVTNKKDIPHAILVRAIHPVEGVTRMRNRRNNPKVPDSRLCVGPGTVAQALGIHFSHSGKSLLENEIWIEDRDIKIKPDIIVTGQRIGVDYAGKDALLPYRFKISNSFFSYI